MTEHVTVHQELAELAEAYREADQMEKAAKAAKEQLRLPIFELISEVVREEIPLARKKIFVTRDEMSNVYEDEFEEWRIHNYPTWVIVGVVATDKGYEIEVEEDPLFMKYEFVVGDFKYGRTVQIPTPTFDAESFVNDNPELAELVDEETVVTYKLNEFKASRYMSEHPESKAMFEKYVKVGTPTTKMMPIRQVSEE